jgi:hypothetical protein
VGVVGLVAALAMASAEQCQWWGIDSDGSGHIGISGGGGNGELRLATAAETGSAVAAAAIVAMAVADNNRNCGGRQQSTKCSRGSNGDSGRGSSNHGSAATIEYRGSGMAEVTRMRAATMATTAVVNLYPNFPLAMVRDDRERR